MEKVIAVLEEVGVILTIGSIFGFLIFVGILGMGGAICELIEEREKRKNR